MVHETNNDRALDRRAHPTLHQTMLFGVDGEKAI